MNSPSAPMLEEFRLIGAADLTRPGELDRLADAICDLFTDDCLLEDTSTTDVVRGRAELHDYCKALFGPFSDVRIVPTEILDHGNVSTMVLRISGRHTGDFAGIAPTGREVWFPAVAIYRCNEDNTKVRHETLAYDTGFITAQMT